MRYAIGIALVMLCLATVSGCSLARRETPPQATAVVPEVTLTTAMPTAQIPLQALSHATNVDLDVRAVENPTRQGLVIAANLSSAASHSGQISIGEVSLYPSDQPARFRLSLPPSGTALAAQGPTLLSLTLGPALPGATLQPNVQIMLAAYLS